MLFSVCFPADWTTQPGVSNGQLALSSFDGSINGGDDNVLLIATYFSDENAAGDAPLYRSIAAALRDEFPGRTHALVSLKGSTSCESWAGTYLSGDNADAITVLDDTNSVMHYGLFNANPQYVIVDKAMRVRERFTDVHDLNLERIRRLVLGYLAEPSPGDAHSQPPPPPPPPPPPLSSSTSPQTEPEIQECVEPSNEADCRIAAQAAGYTLGGGGWSFAGPYSTAGCYTHTSGSFRGSAFWSTGSHSPSGNKVRVCMPPASSGSPEPPPAPSLQKVATSGATAHGAGRGGGSALSTSVYLVVAAAAAASATGLM
jgi:hypothetical protein